MIKKIIKSLFLISFFLILAPRVLALSPTIHFFWASGCPHCAKEEVFLETLKEKYSVTVKDYEVTNNPENIALLEKVGKELNTDVSGVPFTVVGREHFIGYLDEETTGKQIEIAVKNLDKNYVDWVENIQEKEEKQELKTKPQQVLEKVNVPIFGELEVKNLSLPVLTIVVALLDGFNPCAMWTLLFLISLLLGMKDRKRMWILGIAFIVSSAFVYFLFLSAWLNFFLFLGLVVWVRLAIGAVALGSGFYYLRDYWVNRDGGCKVTGDKKRQKVFEQIRTIINKRQLLLALVGIIILAFAVNLVELICSAGLPAIYTKILSLSNLPTWQYYSYLLLYILIFMLDDLFIFFMAMITLRTVGIQGKYSRLSRLVGGILMFIIGVLLLFKPEWLMFG